MINKRCWLIAVPAALIISTYAYYQDRSGLYHTYWWLAPLIFISTLGIFCFAYYLYQQLSKKP